MKNLEKVSPITLDAMSMFDLFQVIKREVTAEGGFSQVLIGKIDKVLLVKTVRALKGADLDKLSDLNDLISKLSWLLSSNLDKNKNNAPYSASLARFANRWQTLLDLLETAVNMRESESARAERKTFLNSRS